jgi:hypothetical protein
MTREQWQQRRYKDAPAWMKRPPIDSRERKLEGGYEYLWCPYHKLWQRHRPSECRLIPANKNRPPTTNYARAPPVRTFKRDNRRGKDTCRENKRDYRGDSRRTNQKKLKRKVALHAAENNTEDGREEYDEEEEYAPTASG